jgi:hypothetical protein
MKRLAVVAFLLGFVSVIGLAHAADKNDPTGTWQWEVKRKGKDGTEKSSVVTMKLEHKDGKITGTISTGFGGGGGKGGKGGKDTKIEDGKFENGDITFSITREFGNNKVVTTYTGKVADDTIKGTITTSFNDKENKTDWEAKRVKPDAKKD